MRSMTKAFDIIRPRLIPFLAGGVLGGALAAIACNASWQKKWNKEFAAAVRAETDDYKAKKEAEILAILKPVLPKDEEEVPEETSKKVIKADVKNFQTTALKDYVPYDRMYKRKTPEPVITESSAAETTEEQIGRVDSEALNDIPRDRRGRFQRGGEMVSTDQLEETDEDDRIYLDYYTDDEVLIASDSRDPRDIWDEEELFGESADWNHFKDARYGSDECVMTSTLYPGRVFKITKIMDSFYQGDEYEEDEEY